MTRRCERASTVTSNKGFEEWADIFGDDVMAAALIDPSGTSLPSRDNPRQQLSHTATHELWQTLKREHVELGGGFGKAALVRRQRQLEEARDAEVLRIAIPMKLIGIAESRQAETWPKRVEKLHGSWQQPSRPEAKFLEEMLWRYRESPIPNEPFTELLGTQLAETECFGMLAVAPACTNILF